MEIQGIKLTEEHVGREVTYVPTHAHGDNGHPDCEFGKIKSWNDYGVFVDYGYNTCMTYSRNLIW